MLPLGPLLLAEKTNIVQAEQGWQNESQKSPSEDANRQKGRLCPLRMLLYGPIFCAEHTVACFLGSGRSPITPKHSMRHTEDGFGSGRGKGKRQPHVRDTPDHKSQGASMTRAPLTVLSVLLGLHLLSAKIIFLDLLHVTQ